MIKKIEEKGRLSIDIGIEEHKQIKMLAASQGKSIREYVLETIRERLKQETKDVHQLSGHLEEDVVLKELWDNNQDAAYDKL